MRPEILFPFFSPLIATKGLGKATAPLVERLIGGNQLVDLLWHWPQSRVDRRAAPPLAQAPDGAVISPLVRVVEHKPSPDGRFGKRRRGGGGAPSPYRVVVADDSGTMTLVWFHGQADWIARMLPADTERVVSGRVEWRGNELQMVHPDHVVPPEDAEIARTVEPVYPLTQGLSNKVISKIIRTALGVVGPAEDPHWPEWQDKALLAQRHWPDWNSALRQVHAPEEAKDLDRSHPARQRLIYDELLASQLALALTRRAMRRVQGQALKGDGRLRQAVRQALPFALTGAQERSLTEIEADLAAETRMLRLLQGDVGSGKTMVALLTLLVAVEAGRQGVLMAPTELVARQHVDSLAPLCEPLGVRIVLLTGRDKGKRRDSLVADLAEGRADIAIGTHALFQSDVQFQDLALAVVDEQHRFGVHQRLALSDKGRGVDVLVMTATPIPRTLALTHYGDMAVSRLDEKPPGRKPVDTRALPSSRLEDVMAGIGRAMADGAQIYWVCPLVEETDQPPPSPPGAASNQPQEPLTSAEERADSLADRFGAENVGLIHGKMKGPDKDAVMARFAAGELPLLVATTVIEVGVNVPRASVMVIEHAERFGLAQLHQLRGRIGRGSAASTCLLLYRPPLSKMAKARLELMRRTEDGFEIAEEDLRLRGGGEVLGVRQSGLPGFRLADALADTDLLELATQETKLIVETDPGLDGPRGAALRVLLYLFERDAAVRTLKAG